MSHGGCWPGLTVRDDARGVPGCRSGCLHRSLVEEYRDAKILSDEARKLQRERETGNFPSEAADWDKQHPAWTFKDFLISRKGCRVVAMNIHNAPADMDYYASLTDDQLRELAIEFRNEILDELRRREEAIESLAEEKYFARAHGGNPVGNPETARGYHIPTWPHAR